VNSDDNETNIQAAFEKVALEETKEDKYGNLEKEIMKNVNYLSPDQPGEFIAAACSKLIEIFKQYPNLKSNLTTHNSVLTIMEMLESANENVVFSILQVVNEVRNEN
jgi:hypothetical protein